MIEEAYVSFDVAKLLKEKGFNELCYEWYNPFGSHYNSAFAFNNEGYKNVNKICAPTQQMAMRWLREVHNINIDIVSIWNQKQFEYQVFVVTPENAKDCYVDDKSYLGYEEAVEAAIKYCLENLV